ncbi:hypothetical protein BX666DRAFT_881476 [Dichotomocladium elegans]|nr:hypothetical protein BX666DRAFT_881476 [Dichotomocladium elegans]
MILPPNITPHSLRSPLLLLPPSFCCCCSTSERALKKGKTLTFFNFCALLRNLIDSLSRPGSLYLWQTDWTALGIFRSYHVDFLFILAMLFLSIITVSDSFSSPPASDLVRGFCGRMSHRSYILEGHSSYAYVCAKKKKGEKEKGRGVRATSQRWTNCQKDNNQTVMSYVQLRAAASDFDEFLKTRPPPPIFCSLDNNSRL